MPKIKFVMGEETLESCKVVNEKLNKIEYPKKRLGWALLLAAPLAIICRLIIKLKSNKHGGVYQFDYRFFVLGFIIAFLLGFIHELLHAIPYPKNVNTEIHIEPKSFSASMICFDAVGKFRFLVSSILPIFIGIIPLMIFTITPIYARGLNTILVAISCINLITPCTDYLDFVLVLKQVPNGAKIIAQENGFYWFK